MLKTQNFTVWLYSYHFPAFICATLIWCAFSFVPLICAAQSQAASPSISGEVQENISQAIKAEAATQKQIDQWQVHRDDMLEDIRMYKLELQWLELQQKKLTRYVENNKNRINELEEEQGRYSLIALDMENSLLEHLEKLQKEVANDLPFLPEERANRLRFLEESLNDPELGIGEKYRRFAEALNIEADYGKRLEISQSSAKLDDRQTDLTVINAGRVGYYCLTSDRKQAGIWNKAKSGFVSGDNNMLNAVRRLEEMAQSRQYLDLVSLPLPKE